MTKDMIENIVDDFIKIRKYLKFSKKYRLYLDPLSDEGFCDDKNKVIVLGIKDSYYSRVLLIHECVHATGKNHSLEDGFISTVRLDSYSHDLELKIFGNKPLPERDLDD